MKVKDYLALKRIFDYLLHQRDLEQDANDGFSNSLVNNLNDMLVDLKNILNKIENEE